jgi:hypothetical protein
MYRRAGKRTSCLRCHFVLKTEHYFAKTGSGQTSGNLKKRVAGQTNASDGLPYMAGTFVWTLSDYYGEARQRWPAVNADFGSFDLVRPAFLGPAAAAAAAADAADADADADDDDDDDDDDDAVATICVV